MLNIPDHPTLIFDSDLLEVEEGLESDNPANTGAKF